MQLNVSSESKELDVAEIRRYLETRVFGIGDKLLYLPTVDSTNSLAMKLANERPEEGVVVLTDSQTAGKGRLGRRWVDVAGCNVLSSTLLRPHFPPHFLIMVASLAIVDTIIETCGVTATIKWPNDVLIGERKVAGILIETSHNSLGQLVAILGIGVNVNGTIPSLLASTSMLTSSASTASTQEQVPLGAVATTLAMECGRNLSRETFIAHLLAYIENGYLALQEEVDNPSAGVYTSLSAFRSIWQRWRNHLSTLGRTVVVRQGNTDLSGIAEDVNDHGELLLRRHSGELITITWGDVGYPNR